MTLARPLHLGDNAAIIEALSLILQPGQVTELRALDVSTASYRQPHTVSGYFTDWQALADAASRITSAKAIYFVPNEVNPALLARAANRVRDITREPTTSDTDITARRCFLVDVDPIRPADISSSDDEHGAALDLSQVITDTLLSLGWPEPILADSGNGGHAIWRIDEPADDGGLIKRCLDALAFRFNTTQVSIDQKVFNPARIWKLPGTWARKGDNTPDRPHRMARLLNAPSSLSIVPHRLLEELAATIPQQEPVGRRQQGAAALGLEPLDVAAWIGSHGLAVQGPYDWQGGTRWIFPECPWDPNHRNRSAFILQFANGAIAAGCHHNGCAGRDWHALRELVEPGWREPRAARSGAKASGGRKRAAASPEPTAQQGPRAVPQEDPHDQAALPRIDAGEQDLKIITGESWTALTGANRPERLFRYGGLPVRLECENGKPLPRELTVDRLRHEMARAANFYRVRDRDGIQTIDKAMPPTAVIRDMLATPEPELPPLLRIVHVPVFAPDRTLQTTAGYHSASRTYYAPAKGFTLEEVPAHPSDAEISQARSLLLDELLADFKFVSDADKAHAVALFLEPFVRDMIAGPTPLHLIEAPTPGSGKGLLAEVLLSPAVGHEIGVIPQVADDDEMRKQITARLLEARAAILIDNITRTLSSATLAAALTATWWSDRPLGRSETVSLPVRCAWVATANNPPMSTEIARRVVRSRLNPMADRPWLRSGFRHTDLRAWAAEHRAKLVWSGLTMAQAWLDKGQPAPACKPLGSYERWSHVLGGILETAGIPGFLTNLDEFYESADSEGTMWRQFVGHWWDKHASKKVKAADLFPLSTLVDGFDLNGKTERAQQVTFGKKLATLRDRVIGDYRVVHAGTAKRISLWRLLPLHPAGEDGPIDDSDATSRVYMEHIGVYPDPTPTRAGGYARAQEKTTGGGNIHPYTPYTPFPVDDGCDEEDTPEPTSQASSPVQGVSWDEVLAGLGADAALTRGLARKLQEQPNANALDFEWRCLQAGNYRTLGEDAQHALQRVYDDHRRRLVAGGAR